MGYGAALENGRTRNIEVRGASLVLQCSEVKENRPRCGRGRQTASAGVVMGVRLARLSSVMLGVQMVTVGGMRVIGGLGMLARFVVRGGMLVMLGGLGVVLGGSGVVFSGGMGLRHEGSPGWGPECPVQA
jgi:hypothetical protein